MMLKLKDLLTEKPIADMNGWELMHNCVFAKNKEVWFRDFDREISARDLLRQIHQAIGEKEYAEFSNEELDEILLEDATLGYDTVKGVLGLLYYIMCGFCNIRELALKEAFADIGETKSNLETDVEEVLGSISKLFRNKNKQYRTNNDDLANFTKGAMLRYGKADMPAKFEALKDYVSKHIAKVYNGKLMDDKMDESIMDIAVYFVLAAVMHKRMKASEANAE